MSPQIRKVAAIISTSALLGGGGLAAANAATAASDGSASTSGTTSTSNSPTMKRGGAMSAATLAKIADALGVSSTDLQAAVDAGKPAKQEQRGDRGAGHSTELASALGVDAAKVKTILDANRPQKGTSTERPARGAKPDQTKLAAALASGLDLDAATVKAALAKLDAARAASKDSRHDAMYSAVAKKLGVSASDVKAAFDANRPTPPQAPTTTTG